jgi:RND superfamily putative drug exporter
MVDLGDLVVIPDDISALVIPGSDVRKVVKSAAKLKSLAPDAITVADPLAFCGCSRMEQLDHRRNGDHPGSRHSSNGRHAGALRNGNGRRQMPWAGRGVHPVTVWRGRLSVALDALEVDTHRAMTAVERRIPVETTNVQLPTGDRLQIPTGAETLRLKGYLLMCRNSSRDYAEFAELVASMDIQTAASVLAGMDEYYRGRQRRNQWVATQLLRRLADPRPSDDDEDPSAALDPDVDWSEVRQRCLSVAVAMLEETR